MVKVAYLTFYQNMSNGLSLGIVLYQAHSKTKQEFIDQAVKPINSFFTKPLKPIVNHIIAQGNNVVVLWDGVTQAKDGRLYKNNYAWHFVMENKKAIEVNAYLDVC